MHIDEERIQRLLHEELPSEDRAEVAAHLAACATCREVVAVASREDREVLALLGRLDHEPPDVTATELATRSSAVGRSWIRWAASLVIFAAFAGAAIAMPGSPLRGWIDGLVRRDAPPVEPIAREVPDRPVGSDAGLPEPEAGVAVAPGIGMRIDVVTGSFSGVVVIALSDSDSAIVVLAPSGSAAFTSAGDRLLVGVTRDSTNLRIRIPRNARRVELLVDGNRRFLKEGERLTVAPSVAEDPFRVEFRPRE